MISNHTWVFIFGLLGNITSFVVFLAPLPTFYRVCKKKSTEGFSSVPYLVALFSAMILIYYGTTRPGAFLLITINSFGCFIETIYLALFIAYAPKQARMFTLRILILLDFGGFCLLLLVAQFLVKGANREHLLGWVTLSFSLSVFAAPLSVMRMIIRTKSVEFMPFSLSFFLTLSAIMWLCYGIFLKDFYIACPNVLGFLFGMVQMVLYAKYRNNKTITQETKVPEHTVDIAKLSTILNSSESQVCSDQQPHEVNRDENRESHEGNALAQTDQDAQDNHIHDQPDQDKDRYILGQTDPGGDINGVSKIEQFNKCEAPMVTCAA